MQQIRPRADRNTGERAMIENIGNSIRTLLNTTFPGTEFSVRKERSRSALARTRWIIRWSGEPADNVVKTLIDPIVKANGDYAYCIQFEEPDSLRESLRLRPS
jgi:hypothetical protein